MQMININPKLTKVGVIMLFVVCKLHNYIMYLQKFWNWLLSRLLGNSDVTDN